MASIHAVLRRKMNARGLYPVALRITQNRRSSYVHLGIHISPDQWDNQKRRVKKHKNASRLNAKITKKLAEAHDKYLELEMKNKVTTARKIRDHVEERYGTGTFFDQATRYLTVLKKEGKRNQWSADAPRIGRFKKFLGGQDVAFEDITVNVLKDFRAHLIHTHKVSERTAMNYLVVIRTIYNQGIRNGLADAKHYPFGRGKIVIRFPESRKEGLTKQEVTALATLDLSAQPKLNHARNIWLVAFYFAGMRISDVLLLRWSDLKDGRLHYKMAKNKKTLSLKIPDQAQAIFAKYEDRGTAADDFIFAECLSVSGNDDRWDVQLKIANAVKLINKNLRAVARTAGITKHLTTHIARHTFGSISGDRIPVQILQKLYRHSDIQTTIAYQQSFIHDTDQALDDVLDF